VTTSGSGPGTASHATSGSGATSTASVSAGGAGGAVSSTSAGGTAGAGGQGGSGGFPSILGEGVWLIGWSGGLDHYSWLRFDFVDEVSGNYQVIDATCPSCTGLYMCQGTNTFNADPATGELHISLPLPCAAAHTLDFQSFSAPSGFFPNAVLEAQILDVGTASMLIGAQFPAAQCDSAFTTCANPFM
jgi:hypothetical protein